MAEHDAFLAAIRHEPDDDAPRLVYADFLDETGETVHEARANLIRTQIEESKLADETAKRRRLRQHARMLLRQHEHVWIGSFRGIGHEFRRGFVESIRIELAAFPRLADTLFAAFPLREIELVGPHGDRRMIEALANSPHLARLRSLRFAPAAFNQEGLGDAGLEILLRSPHLAGLRDLEIERQRLTNEAVAMLAGCANLVGLRTLKVGHNRPNQSFAQGIDGDAMAILATSPYLRNLTHLDLNHLELGTDGFDAIADAESMRGLTHLNLHRCGLGSHGVQALASSKYLRGLLHLDLRNNRLGVRAAVALAHSRHLSQLRCVDLSGNRLTDPGMAHFAASPNVRSLRSLTARRNRLGNEAAEAIARSQHLAELRTLDLRHNQLSVAGGKALALSEGFPNLETFDLRGNAIPHAHKAELRKVLGKKFGRL